MPRQIFLATSPFALTFEMLCRRLSIRPSAALGVTDLLEALDLDLALAAVGVHQEAEALKEARERARDREAFK